MKTKQRNRKDGRPNKKALAEIVQSVVEAAQPDKIILFGSAARGEMGLNSDIDLLVIKSGKFNRDRVTRNIYRNLSAAAAVDALVVTPEVLEQYGDSPYLVYYPALREGKIIYDTGKKECHGSNQRTNERSGDAPRCASGQHAEGYGISSRGQHGAQCYPPTDPREWLTRSRSNLAMAQADNTARFPKTCATRPSRPLRKRLRPSSSIAA